MESAEWAKLIEDNTEKILSSVKEACRESFGGVSKGTTTEVWLWTDGRVEKRTGNLNMIYRGDERICIYAFKDGQDIVEYMDSWEEEYTNYMINEREYESITNMIEIFDDACIERENLPFWNDFIESWMDWYIDDEDCGLRASNIVDDVITNLLSL